MAKRLGRLLSTDESVRVNGLIDEASVLVIAYLGRSWPWLEDVPESVRIVCSRMVARCFATGSGSMDPGLQSYSSAFGPMSVTSKFADGVVHGQPYLSSVDRQGLFPLAVARGITNSPLFELEE